MVRDHVMEPPALRRRVFAFGGIVAGPVFVMDGDRPGFRYDPRIVERQVTRMRHDAGAIPCAGPEHCIFCERNFPRHRAATVMVTGAQGGRTNVFMQLTGRALQAYESRGGNTEEGQRLASQTYRTARAHLDDVRKRLH